MLKLSDIADKIIIKRSIEAEKRDTQLFEELKSDPYTYYQSYRDAYNGTDSYMGYRFSVGDLSPFISNAADINRIVKDNSLLPLYVDNDTLQLIMSAKRQTTLDNYVEMNNYYRPLLGLPDIVRDDETGLLLESPTEIIYLKDKITGVDISKPIHKFTPNEKKLLKSSGVLAKLRVAFPNILYLKYIDRNIDVMTARDAKPFDIMWYDETHDYMVDFVDHYRSVRNKFLTAHNNQFDDISYDKWENLMCINLLLTALASYNAYQPVLDAKDSFATKQDVWNLFTSYGLPKWDFNLSILSDVATKINTLTRKKGTKGGLKEISKIFDGITIFKYYILKRVNTDANLDDPDLKNDDKYELYFAKVPIDKDDPYEYIQDSSELLDYNTIVNRDEKWGYKDNKLASELKNKDFSYSESKYIGLNNKIDIFSFSMEMSYFYRFAVEHKKKLEHIKFYLDTVDVQCDLFELLTYLQLLVFKKYHVTPDIPDTIESVLNMYAIKNNIDASRIKLLIKDYFKYHKEDMRYNIDTWEEVSGSEDTLGSVVDIFETDYDMVRYLYKIRAEVTDYRDFCMIDDTLRALAYGEKLPTLYNGHTNLEDFISTYSSESTKYLVRLGELDDGHNLNENINEEITVVLNCIREKISSIKNDDVYKLLDTYQNLYADADVLQYLEKIVDFYKSYTQDIIDRGITYTADDLSDAMYILEQITFYVHLTDFEMFTLSLLFMDDSTEVYRMVKQLFTKEDLYSSTEVLSRVEKKIIHKVIASDGYSLNDTF